MKPTGSATNYPYGPSPWIFSVMNCSSAGTSTRPKARCWKLTGCGSSMPFPIFSTPTSHWVCSVCRRAIPPLPLACWTSPSAAPPAQRARFRCGGSIISAAERGFSRASSGRLWRISGHPSTMSAAGASNWSRRILSAPVPASRSLKSTRPSSKQPTGCIFKPEIRRSLCRDSFRAAGAFHQDL